MFQYHIQDRLFKSDTLQIYNGVVKSTKEEIEITTIKRDCYKYCAEKIELEKYLKSRTFQSTMIDIFPSKVFPTNTSGDWLVIVETKRYYSLTDFILNNVEIENESLQNLDILSLIYDLISTVLSFSNYHQKYYFYQRLTPQNIFVSDYNQIFLKFPYWLLLDDTLHTTNTTMLATGLNFSESYRYYLPPHLLLGLMNDDDGNALPLCDVCNADIWCLGICICEIFYGLPLFSSVSISDQLLKMFQILGYPKWNNAPWKYWKIGDELKKSIERQRNEDKQDEKDLLNKIMNNAAIVDLLRCCLQYTSHEQITLNQLEVFVDMFEINHKIEKEQHRLTFHDIRNNNNQNINNANHQSDVVLIGSSTFLKSWSLWPGSPKRKKDVKSKTVVPSVRVPTEKPKAIQNKAQKGCQTTKVITKDSTTNTEQQDNVVIATAVEANAMIETNANTEPENEMDHLMITDCVKGLPFTYACDEPLDTSVHSKIGANLLILEFSNIEYNGMNKENVDLFSFACAIDHTKQSVSSPLFDVNKKKEKVYIHIMLSSVEYEYILNDKMDTLQIQFIAHNQHKQSQHVIGQLEIDIALLKESEVIEAYYDINQPVNEEPKRKIGQVFIRVLPQFTIVQNKDCNESTTTTLHSDDTSFVSNEAWKMFNSFVSTHK